MSDPDYRKSLEFALGVPFSDGNDVQLLHNGDAIFPAMLRAIDAAQHTVDFETFVYWKGDIARQFAESLAARAKAGVTVRVLLDAFGAKEMEPELAKLMQSAGCELRWFRPLSTWRAWQTDKRTHRKILVCDNLVGFTGGVGIADEWTGDARNADEWRDTHCQVRGLALLGLRAAFLDNWNEAGDWLFEQAPETQSEPAGDIAVQVIRSSSTIGWTDITGLMRNLVALSQRRLYITTAYLVLEPQLIDLLCAAADRGVDVRILAPGKQTDSRFSQLAGQPHYARLMDCGVQLFLYQQTLLHCKLIALDESVSCIGSANLNRRSLGKDEECCIVTISERLNGELVQQLEKDCAQATALQPAAWQNRGWLEKAKEKIATLVVEQV